MKERILEHMAVSFLKGGVRREFLWWAKIGVCLLCCSCVKKTPKKQLFFNPIIGSMYINIFIFIYTWHIYLPTT